MTTVEFFEEGEEYPIASGLFSCVPAVGESITIREKHYEVLARSWGFCCDGTGETLWNKPCVAIGLGPWKEKA